MKSTKKNPPTARFLEIVDMPFGKNLLPKKAFCTLSTDRLYASGAIFTKNDFRGSIHHSFGIEFEGYKLGLLLKIDLKSMALYPLPLGGS